MEECERKKKLIAGKEKLAAFQKKKSRKKKKIKDADSPSLGLDVGELSDVSSTSDMSSEAEIQSNEDSDQQSLSGLSDDETPKEEGNLPSLLRLKAKLQSANQRIEELEECIMGKQLALDKVIVENEKLRREVASEQVEKLEGTELKESGYFTQDSRQSLLASESINGDISLKGEKGDLSDIQDLTQQVQWLQVQLKQAGVALQVQADHQSLSVQALQEAKSEILNLQQNVTQKDQAIYQLAEKLTQVSQQYSLLQRAHDSLKNEDKKDTDSTFSITEMEVKLEGLKLELETKQTKTFNEMSNVLEAKKQELDGFQTVNEELKKACETYQVELRNQREELEIKIAKLSEELINAQASSEKLRQHLESVNEENRALLDECNRTKTEKEEANFKIKVLEQQLKDSLDHMEKDKLKLESVEIELLSERDEKVKVDKELQKYKEEVMMLKEEKEHANRNLQQFNEEITSLKDEKEKANAEKSLLLKQFEDFKETFTSEFQSLTSQLNETLEQTSHMKSMNEVLSQEVEKLKADKSGMLEQLDMYHSQVTEYEGTISQMHGLQEENKTLRMQNDELYNKINNQKDIIVGLKAELDVLSVDNKQLGEQLQVFTSDLSQHQSEIDIIETERHAFTEEMENLQRHYMDLQSESEVYKSSTASLSQKIAELKQELSISTTDNSSQVGTISSADDYQIGESAQRRMMPLEERTITPSVVIVTHEEMKENYDNTESAVLTTWTLDQAQSLESQNNIIEQQSQKVEEGMIMPDVSTVVTVHLDKTWEDQSSLKESPDTPESLPTLLELAANHEDPSKSSLDQITQLIDKIQKLYSILAAVSVQNLISSLAIDGNTGAQKDGSDASIGSFMSSGDGVERKQDKDFMFMAERFDIERVRFKNLMTCIQNLQKCLSKLSYSLEETFPLSPRCSVTDVVGDSMPSYSPKQMMVTSLDDIGVKVSSSNLQVEMSCQGQLNPASSSLIDCCQGDIDLGLSDYAFVLPTAVDACIQIEDSRQKLNVRDSEMETSQGNMDTISRRDVESRQSIVIESNSHFEVEIELEQSVSRQEIESLNIEIGRLQEVLKVCLTEKADLLELVETERHRAETAKEGLQIAEEQCQKCSKDLENQITCKQQLQSEFDSMRSKLSELETSLSQISIENEVLVSERDKLADQNEELKDISDNFKSDIIVLESKVSEMSEENKTLKSVGDKLLEQGLFLSQSMNDKVEMEATIGELEQTLSTLQQALDSLEQEKDYLKEELERKESIEEKIEDLAGAVSEFQEHRAKLEMENELLRQESTKFQLMAHDIARTHEELKEDRRCLVERLEAIVEEKEKFESEKANLLSEFQDELGDLRNENEGLKTKVEAFECITDEREKLSQELNDFKKMCEKLNEKIFDLTAEKENLIIKYESEMDGLMQESSTLKTKESSLQDEVQELLQKLTDKDHLKENLVCIEQQGSKIQNVCKKDSTAMVVIHCIKKEVQNLIRQVRRDDSFSVSTDEIESQVCEHDNGLIPVTNEDGSFMENELDELKLEVEQLKLEINDAQNSDFVDYKNMVPEIGGKMFSKTNREPRASENSDKESLLSQLELEKKYKAKMQRDIENLQKDYEILQRKFAQVQEDLERYHQHLSSVEEERNELEDLTLQLQEDMKLALVDRDNVHQEFETLEMEYNTLDQQKDGFVEEIQTLQMHLKAVSENRNHVRTQVEILAAELDNVSKSRDDFAIKYYVLEKENQSLRAENSKNLHYFGIIQDKVSQFEKVLDEKYGLEGENRTLTQRIECLNDRVDSLEKEKESLSHLTQRLTNSLGVIQTKYEEIKSDMETTKKNCDREIEMLKHQLKHVNDSVFELKSTLEFFENELCDTNDERICLKESLERQTAEIQEVIEEKQKLQELNEKYQKDLKNKKIFIEQQNQRTSHIESHDPVSILTTHEMGVQTEAEFMAGTVCMDVPSIFETASTGFQTDISCIMKKVFSLNLNQTEDRLEINESERVHPNACGHPTNISSSLLFDSGVHMLLDRGISHEITSEDAMDPHFDPKITCHELPICDNVDDIKECENELLVCRSLTENDQEGNKTELGNIKENVGVETSNAVNQRKIVPSYEINIDCDYHCDLDSQPINNWFEKSSQTENCETCNIGAQTDHNLIASNILSEDKETFTLLITENRSVQTSSRLLSCSFETLANMDIASTNASHSAVQDICVQTDKCTNASHSAVQDICVQTDKCTNASHSAVQDICVQTDKCTNASHSAVQDICVQTDKSTNASHSAVQDICVQTDKCTNASHSAVQDICVQTDKCTNASHSAVQDICVQTDKSTNASHSAVQDICVQTDKSTNASHSAVQDICVQTDKCTNASHSAVQDICVQTDKSTNASHSAVQDICVQTDKCTNASHSAVQDICVQTDKCTNASHSAVQDICVQTDKCTNASHSAVQDICVQTDKSTNASHSAVQDICVQTDKSPSNYSIARLDCIDITSEGSELEKQTKLNNFSTQTEDSTFSSAFEESYNDAFSNESLISDSNIVSSVDTKESIEKTSCDDLQGPNVLVASEMVTDADKILVHPTEVKEQCQKEKQNVNNQDEQLKVMTQDNFELELSKIKERYELQMKQKEYEFEEKFAMEFRSKQVELMHQMDLEKKEIMKNMELVMKHQVEKIKKEKDKVFVETMRKVRADLKEKHESKLEEIHQKMLSRIPRRSEMVGTPRQTDDETIQRLQKENQQLAKARDALMQQLDLSEQQQKQLQDDLQSLLTDEEWLELDEDDGMEMGNEFGFGEGSVLDWKIPSSLVHHPSQDLASSAGGQDNDVSHPAKFLDNAQCSRPECKALQEKYINIRRKLEYLGGSLLLGGFSERNDVFNEEQMYINQDTNMSAERTDDQDTGDKFISDEDQDAQVLQRLTSIHLEHSVRMPLPTSVPLDNENKFIFDDEGSGSVSHSKDEKCIGKGRSEGHFSEQNSEDEKVEDGHSGGKEGYFSEQESDEEDLIPAHLSRENSPLHTSSGSSSQNLRWTHETGFSMSNDENSQFYEMRSPSKYKEYHERTPISDDEIEVTLSSAEKKTTSFGKSDFHSEKYGKAGEFVPNVDHLLEIHHTPELKVPRKTKSESSDDTKDTSANQGQSHGSSSSSNKIPRSFSWSFVTQEREQHLALLTDAQSRFVSELSPQIENLPLQEELVSDLVYHEETDIIQSDSGFVQESSDMTFRSESDYVKESSEESSFFVKDFDIGKSVLNNMVEPEKDKSPSKLIGQSDSNDIKEDGSLPIGPVTLIKHSDMRSDDYSFEVERVDLGGVLESAVGQVVSISSASADILEPSGGDDAIHRETDDYKSLRKLYEELKLQIDILKEEKDSLEIKVLLHEELESKLKILEEEKQYMEEKIKEQMVHFEKEKQEFMSRSSLLVAEMESLALSKDQLEDKLRKQQEEFEQYVIKLEETRSDESPRESNQENQELKLKVLDLEKDIREKDAYVRKLEEHFLNQEKGLPSKGGTVSLLSPGIGKAIISERGAMETRRHSLNFSIGKVEQNNREMVREPSESFCAMDQTESLSLDGDFVDAMHRTEYRPEYRHFQNSIHLHQTPADSHFIDGDGDSSLPFPDKLEPLDDIGLSLNQSVDGHVAMEQKHFELLEEISHLKRDFRETKAIYSKEIVLLQTTLEKERCLREGLLSRTDHQNMNCQDILSSDVVHLRQKVAVLNETNKLLRIENDRWLLRIKEQEAVVMELREKLWYQKGGIDDMEEVFGKQLALLQKQREDLIEQLRKWEHDNGKLSQILGEKAVLEDTLKKEKAIILKKLQEKAAIETQLREMELEVVRQKQELKRLEELIYQKDFTERELMRQKRLLEEELRDIEAKFRDREEHLGIEKNKLLDELRHERLGIRSRNQHSEGDIDNVSVASDSSSISTRSTRSLVSEIEFGRLELMLEEVGRQHSNAVEVLRDKLSSGYKRKDRAILQKHVSVLQSSDQRSEETDC